MSDDNQIKKKEELIETYEKMRNDFIFENEEHQKIFHDIFQILGDIFSGVLAFTGIGYLVYLLMIWGFASIIETSVIFATILATILFSTITITNIKEYFAAYQTIKNNKNMIQDLNEVLTKERIKLNELKKKARCQKQNKLDNSHKCNNELTFVKELNMDCPKLIKTQKKDLC